MGALLALAGMAVVLVGAPAALVWRLVTWRSAALPAPDLAAPARALRSRLRFALFTGLLPAWGVGLILLLLGVALSGRG